MPAGLSSNFGAVVATIPAGPGPGPDQGTGAADGQRAAVGFAYGFHGLAGQWWHDVVRQSLAARHGSDAAGHDAIHHEAMAKTPSGAAQHTLTQHAAMRQHDAERRVVADRAEIAEVVGNTLQFGHQGAQPNSAWWRLDAECGFHRASEGVRVGDRAVAGSTTGKACGPLQCGAVE